MWIEYRHKFAHGSDDPMYLEVSDRSTEQDILEEMFELQEEYAWTDLYRGIEWHIVPHPPVEALEQLYQAAINTAICWSNRVNELDEQIKAVRAQTTPQGD